MVNAVIEKLALEYGAQLRAEMKVSASVEDALLKMTEVKALFFERYFLLVTQAEHLEMTRNGSSLQGLKKAISTIELPLIGEILEKGMRQGELKRMDACKTGELLLETLFAFSRCIKEKGALPEREAFREILSKQREVIRIFYQGLKAEKWVN